MTKSRILLVDDEPGFNRLLKLVLQNTGPYSVREENEATKAVDTAKEFKPDLILMDSIMPKIDGVSVTKTLRAEAQFSDTPFCFCPRRWWKTMDSRRRSPDSRILKTDRRDSTNARD